MNRKRKIDDNHNDNNKRQHIVDWNNMISASSIRNYLLNDPLLDWLKYYSINNINDIPMQKKNDNFTKFQSTKSNILSFNNFIMEQGNLFEKIVFDKLKEQIQNTDIKMVQVSFNNEAQSYNKYMETLNYMKEGVDIIYQGVLHDYKKHLYGVPDLLVRSDKFYKIFNQQIQYPHYKSKINYHYVVVDIKHSSIYLNCNKTFIKDINSIPAYKGQILIYNKILSEFLGYIPQYGFILSKKIIFTKKNISYSCDNFMENIATIDYKGVDKNYNYLTNRAIEWVRIMRTDGHTWRLLPTPSVLELHPNMKNDKDDGYRNIKIDLAERINEITNLMIDIKIPVWFH